VLLKIKVSDSVGDTDEPCLIFSDDEFETLLMSRSIQLLMMHHSKNAGAPKTDERNLQRRVGCIAQVNFHGSGAP